MTPIEVLSETKFATLAKLHVAFYEMSDYPSKRLPRFDQKKKKNENRKYINQVNYCCPYTVLKGVKARTGSEHRFIKRKQTTHTCANATVLTLDNKLKYYFHTQKRLLIKDSYLRCLFYFCTL